MELRKAEYDDYEAIVAMYYDLVETVYPERKLAPMMYFYKLVASWFDDQNANHIRVVEKDGELVAFSLATFDNVQGVTETVYHADIAYVKPEYQKTRAGYLMYMDIVNWSIQNGFVLQTSAIPETGADDIIEKRFNSNLRFRTFAQRPELIKEWLEENNPRAIKAESGTIKF